jgi:hypothetical protein
VADILQSVSLRRKGARKELGPKDDGVLEMGLEPEKSMRSLRANRIRYVTPT